MGNIDIFSTACKCVFEHLITKSGKKNDTCIELGLLFIMKEDSNTQCHEYHEVHQSKIRVNLTTSKRRNSCQKCTTVYTPSRIGWLELGEYGSHFLLRTFATKRCIQKLTCFTSGLGKNFGTLRIVLLPTMNFCSGGFVPTNFLHLISVHSNIARQVSLVYIYYIYHN